MTEKLLIVTSSLNETKSNKVVYHCFPDLLNTRSTVQELSYLADSDIIRPQPAGLSVKDSLLNLQRNPEVTLQKKKFGGDKNEKFHHKKLNIFMIFAQSIDYGYILEPPRQDLF